MKVEILQPLLLRYKGLVQLYSASKFNFIDIEYEGSFRELFPLFSFAHYQSDIDANAKTYLSSQIPSASLEGAATIDVIGQRSFAIGGCSYDVKVVRTRLRVEPFPEKTSVGAAKAEMNVGNLVKYYAPALETSLAFGEEVDGKIEMDVAFDEIGLEPSGSERLQ